MLIQIDEKLLYVLMIIACILILILDRIHLNYEIKQWEKQKEKEMEEKHADSNQGKSDHQS